MDRRSMITESKICIICQSLLIKDFDYKNYEYFRCHNCQTTSTFPLPTKAAIKMHYKEGYSKGNYKFLREYSKEYLRVYEGLVKLLEKQLSTEGKKISKVKILDLGCFTGDFLLLLDRKGANVLGFELQADAVKIANKKLPGKIIQANIMDGLLKNRKFDVVCLLGVIEHVTNPDKLIAEVSKITKKGGLIFIQTPNSGSILAKMLGKYWPPYSPIEHIHLFSKKSLLLLLKKNGYEEKISKSHLKILPVGYIYNMLDLFGPEFKRLLKPFVDKFNLENSRFSLPFYIGEMIVIAKKNN